MDDDYELRRLAVTDEGLFECNRLLRSVFVDATIFSEAFLKWQYEENPAGHAVGFNAYAGETLAAHYVTQPARCMIHGQEQLGLLSLNTATHAEHRKKGLFTRLASRTYEAAAKEGFQFVFGVANSNSVGGFIRKLGFQSLGQLDVQMGIRCQGTAHVEGRGLSFFRCWDRASLKWRLSNPSRAYEIRGGRVYLDSERMGHMRMMAGEFAPEDLSGLPSRRIESQNPLEMFVGFEPGQVWRPPMHVNVPLRLHRKSLTMIFLDLTGAGRTLDPGAIRLRLLDADY